MSRDGGSYVLIETRQVAGTRKAYVFDEVEASSLLASGPYTGSQIEAWALQQKLAVLVDGWFVPLLVADPKILLLMEEPKGAADGEGPWDLNVPGVASVVAAHQD
jgi:hypothetical protein